MRQSIIRDLGILIGIFGLIWLASSVFNFFPEDPVLLGVDAEQKIGETYLDLVLLNPIFKEFEDDRIDSAIKVIGDRLEEGLEFSKYSYNLVVFRNETINAFTLPGGNILISTGLIGFCESPEELAAVIAHEMGHVEERHVVSRLIKELGIDIITSGDTYVLGEVTSIITSTGFDRRQEEEADLFACNLLEQSNIEPRILATFFRRLDEEIDNDLLKSFEIVSTHPNFNSRIREALSYDISIDFKEVPFDLQWEGIRSEILRGKKEE
jgi:predicted Zn-dependent protease